MLVESDHPVLPQVAHDMRGVVGRLVPGALGTNVNLGDWHDNPENDKNQLFLPVAHKNYDAIFTLLTESAWNNVEVDIHIDTIDALLGPTNIAPYASGTPVIHYVAFKFPWPPKPHSGGGGGASGGHNGPGNQIPT